MDCRADDTSATAIKERPTSFGDRVGCKQPTPRKMLTTCLHKKPRRGEILRGQIFFQLRKGA